MAPIPVRGLAGLGTGAIEALVKAGVDPNDLLKTLGEGTQEGVQRIPGETRRALLRDILASVIGGGIATAVPNLVESIVKPSAIAGPPAEGRYMVGPDVDLRLIPDYRADVFRTRLLNLLPGVELPMPRSPQDVLGEIEARITRQARDLTEREIAKTRAEREFDVALKRLETQGALQRAQVEAASAIRQQEIASGADIRSRELQSLGDVQRQRLSSSYDFAKGALENAIQNVLQSGVINDRSVQQELARIQ